MLTVKVKTNDDGFMTIEATGHTHSTICASVSTLLQSNVRYLQELSQHFPEYLKVEVEK